MRSRGFGNRSADTTDASNPRRKPLKRPSQARAKVTVKAIYDAFVRIWRTRGWAGVTTRAVALETGIAVGTLYDYFPNKEALLSGYVRHCIDWMLECIDREVGQGVDLGWRQRVPMLVQISCGGHSDAPYYDRTMHQLQNRDVEDKHHARVYQELAEHWLRSLNACADAPKCLDVTVTRGLVLTVIGTWRYALLLKVQPTEGWLERLIDTCTQQIESL